MPWFAEECRCDVLKDKFTSIAVSKYSKCHKNTSNAGAHCRYCITKVVGNCEASPKNFRSARRTTSPVAARIHWEAPWTHFNGGQSTCFHYSGKKRRLNWSYFTSLHTQADFNQPSSCTRLIVQCSVFRVEDMYIAIELYCLLKSMSYTSPFVFVVAISERWCSWPHVHLCEWFKAINRWSSYFTGREFMTPGMYCLVRRLSILKLRKLLSDRTTWNRIYNWF